MSPLAHTGLAILIAAVGSAVIVHSVVHAYRRACLIAAVVAVLVFAAGARAGAGVIDRAAVAAMVTCAVAGWAVALAVGIPFRNYRARRESEGKP